MPSEEVGHDHKVVIRLGGTNVVWVTFSHHHVITEVGHTHDVETVMGPATVERQEAI